jgi:hypothetical protein
MSLRKKYASRYVRRLKRHMGLNLFDIGLNSVASTIHESYQLTFSGFQTAPHKTIIGASVCKWRTVQTREKNSMYTLKSTIQKIHKFE